MISADGHPVGGSLMFSVGEASATPVAGALPAGDPAVRGALWAAKLVIYLALLHRDRRRLRQECWLIGGAEPPWLDRTLVALIAAGLLLTPLSVGLQGLDALDVRLHRARAEARLGDRPRDLLRPDRDRRDVSRCSRRCLLSRRRGAMRVVSRACFRSWRCSALASRWR